MSLFNSYIGVATLLLWLAPNVQSATSAGFIATIVGTGTAGSAGDGGAATSAELYTPYSAVIDNDGSNLYISDLLNGKVRKVAFQSGSTISTFAGSGYSLAASGTSSNGDGGAATSAVVFPADVAIDTSSNDIYVVDTTANKIRKIDGSTGKITTVVGTGYPAMTGTSFDAGDGGAATSATLLSPFGICLDSSDSIYIADTSVHKIRKVEKSSGIISTYAGLGVDGTSGDGYLAVLSLLSSPYGVAVYNGATTSARILYIADTGSNRIRKVYYTKTSFGFFVTYIATVAGTGTAGSSGDGSAATSAMLNTPTGVTVDPSGNLYIADTLNNKIRKVAVLSGIITTIAGTGTAGSSGDGGAATSAQLYYPHRISVDVNGAAYIADGLNNKVRVVYGASSTSTYVPSRSPTRAPTGPSVSPTPDPSRTPSSYTLPSFSIPSITVSPVNIPSIISPVSIPSITVSPVNIPSIISPVNIPSITVSPVNIPSITVSPVDVPSYIVLPTATPTIVPSTAPTPGPAAVSTPTIVPSTAPTPGPAAVSTPTIVPSTAPTPGPAAVSTPTIVPSTAPTPGPAAVSTPTPSFTAYPTSRTSSPTAQPSILRESSSLGSSSSLKSTHVTAIGVSVAMVIFGCLAAFFVYYRHVRSKRVYDKWNRWEERHKRKLAGLPVEDEGFSFKLFVKRMSTFVSGQPAGVPPGKTNSMVMADFTQNPLHKARSVTRQAVPDGSRTSAPFSSQSGSDMEHGALYEEG